MVPERITQLLTAYVDGELSARQRKEVSRLLRKSSEARHLYHKIKGDSLILRRLPRKKPKIDLTDTVLGNIAAANLKIPIRPEAIPLPPGPPPLPAKTIPAWVVFAVAAAVLLIVGVGSYFFFAAGGAEIGHDLLAEPRPALSPPCPNCQTVENSLPLPPDDCPKDVFAYPNLKAPSFRAAQTPVPLILSSRDASLPSFTDEMQEELQKDDAFRCDLFHQDNARVFEQLKARLAEQGTELKIEPSLPSSLEQGKKLNVAFYIEGLTPADLAKTFRQLASDRSFTRIVITRLPPWRGFLAGFDIHQPLEYMTLEQVLQAPPRPDRPEPAIQRVAVAVPYNPSQVAPSPAVKSLLNRHSSGKPGTLQILLVLWNNPNGSD